MIRKSLFYSYPTSQMASELGFSKSGCWYLHVGEFAQNNLSEVLCAAKSKEYVLDHAIKMYPELPWGVYSMHGELK